MLFFALTAFAQADESVPGKLEEIKGFAKVGIVAPSKKIRSSMLDALKKEKAGLEAVDGASAAQFFLEFKAFKSKENRSNTEMVELTAYFYNAEKQKVVVWSQAGSFLIGAEGVSLPAHALTRTFVKDLKRAPSGK